MTILALILAYAVGAFPTAYLLARFIRRIDIRQAGSGNTGAMNALRTTGPAAGFLTFAGDLGKGLLAVLIVRWLGGGEAAQYAGACLAVLAHNYNPFLSFRGGKGLAAALGALLLLSPLLPAAVFLSAVLLFIPLRDVNTATGLAVLNLPLFAFFLHGASPPTLFGALLALVIVSRHWADFTAFRTGNQKKQR